jgi:hypothetical protein
MVALFALIGLFFTLFYGAGIVLALHGMFKGLTK